MANVWLERLLHLDDLSGYNREENRNLYNFNYEMYDEEQFRGRFRLTKDSFREILHIIPADIKLLLAIRYYATCTFQQACRDLCDICKSAVCTMHEYSVTVVRAW